MYAQVDALRLRLEEKESLLSKKSQQISELTEEKSTQQGEISDLKDMLDVKERKVNVLQKKVGKTMVWCNGSKMFTVQPNLHENINKTTFESG